MWWTNRAHRAESQIVIATEGSKRPSVHPARRQRLGGLRGVGSNGEKVALQSQGFLNGKLSPIQAGCPHSSPQKSIREKSEGVLGQSSGGKGGPTLLHLPPPSLAPAPAGSPLTFTRTKFTL